MVQGKVVKIEYFLEQGLGVLLDKLKIKGWLDLFANTQKGCSVLDLAEFYANCNITNAVVTSVVNEKKLRFNAKELGEILGILTEGFEVYVREDKNVLVAERFLQLTHRLS